MVDISVSIASEGELESIVELFHQIYLHYFADAAPSRDEISDYVRRNLFQEHCGVQVVLAKENDTPLGIATFAILYPAPGLSGQLFMKGLFTVGAARGRGVGQAIMCFLAQYALQMNCSRFDWTAETTNPKAVEFYDRLGIPRVEEKIYYRLTNEKLKAFAEGGDEHN
ncbi:MAG: GNAT family N-acetyltransferase [Cyanobacteria bacterium REEB67]|nr:GNAT family N-acetyltransferase [Cyanobacteria bacterium REEB67]